MTDIPLKFPRDRADRSSMNGNSVNGNSVDTSSANAVSNQSESNQTGSKHTELSSAPYQDRRSLAISSFAGTVGAGAMIAMFAVGAERASTTASIAVRSIWLYGAFTVIGLAKQFSGSQWAKRDDTAAIGDNDDNPTKALRHLGFAWAASAVMQAVGVLGSFGRPVMVSIAVCDLALRVFAWERARSVKRGLRLASPNPLVLSGLIRTVAGVAALFGIVAFNYSGTEFLLAECAAGIFAVVWSDIALPKRLSMLAQQALATETTVAETPSLEATLSDVAPAPVAQADTIIDLRSSNPVDNAAIELNDEQHVTLALPDTSAKKTALQK
jgi:hypothetical protein